MTHPERSLALYFSRRKDRDRATPFLERVSKVCVTRIQEAVIAAMTGLHMRKTRVITRQIRGQRSSLTCDPPLLTPDSVPFTAYSTQPYIAAAAPPRLQQSTIWDNIIGDGATVDKSTLLNSMARDEQNPLVYLLMAAMISENQFFVRRIPSSGGVKSADSVESYMLIPRWAYREIKRMERCPVSSEQSTWDACRAYMHTRTPMLYLDNSFTGWSVTCTSAEFETCKIWAAIVRILPSTIAQWNGCLIHGAILLDQHAHNPHQSPTCPRYVIVNSKRAKTPELSMPPPSQESITVAAAIAASSTSQQPVTSNTKPYVSQLTPKSREINLPSAPSHKSVGDAKDTITISGPEELRSTQLRYDDYMYNMMALLIEYRTQALRVWPHLVQAVGSTVTPPVLDRLREAIRVYTQAVTNGPFTAFRKSALLENMFYVRDLQSQRPEFVHLSTEVNAQLVTYGLIMQSENKALCETVIQLRHQLAGVETELAHERQMRELTARELIEVNPEKQPDAENLNKMLTHNDEVLPSSQPSSSSSIADPIFGLELATTPPPPKSPLHSLTASPQRGSPVPHTRHQQTPNTFYNPLHSIL